MYNGQRGHPVGFSVKFTSDLSNLRGNTGMAQVNAAQAAIELIVNDVGCVMDIDTTEDLERMRNLFIL
jgi:molybdenum cofactor cytidylyltransferase